MKYRLFFNAATKAVQVAAIDATTPAGFTLLEEIEHLASDNLNKTGSNHKLIHHVQDTLYRKLGIQDTQGLTITWPGVVIPQFVSGGPANLNVTAGTEGTLEVYSFPAELSDAQYSFIANASEEVIKVNLNTGKWAAVGPGTGSIRIEHVATGVHVDVPVTVAPASA